MVIGTSDARKARRRQAVTSTLAIAETIEDDDAMDEGRFYLGRRLYMDNASAIWIALNQ